MLLNIIFLILGVLGAASILIYLLRYLAAPRLFCRVAGEQHGEPIILRATEGRIAFAIGTTSLKENEISHVSVGAADDVELTSEDGDATLKMDQRFPYLVTLCEHRSLSRGHLQGFSLGYKARTDRFEVKVRAVAALRDEEQGFLLDMFSPRKVKYERIVTFRIDPTRKLTLRESGLVIRPGEGLQVSGKQARRETWAAGEPGADLVVREIVEEQRP